MTLPSSGSGKTFWENKEVSVGDPTAAMDHNAIAQNTDWLKETKSYGWGTGLIVSDQTEMKNDSTGTIHFGGWSVMGSSRPSPNITLVDVASQGIPPEPDGFQSRMIALTGAFVAVTDGFLQTHDLQDFLPHGPLDGRLAGAIATVSGFTFGEHWNRLLMEPVPLFAGTGEDVDTSSLPDTYYQKIVWSGALSESGLKDIDLYFWVGDNGNLMFKWTYDNQAQDGWGVVFVGTASYGPVWENLV